MATSATEEELKEWQVIYPSYINSKRTIAEGRRLPREQCCENPSLVDMKQVCEYLKLPCEIEPHKGYSRDILLRGRIRVQVKKDHVPVNPEVPTKKELMRKLGEFVPRAAEKRAAETAAKSKKGGKGGKGGKKKKK